MMILDSGLLFMGHPVDREIMRPETHRVFSDSFHIPKKRYWKNDVQILVTDERPRNENLTYGMSRLECERKYVGCRKIKFCQHATVE